MSTHLSDENFKQETEYENHLSPIRLYHTHVKDGQPDTLFHWHPDLEINYVHEGTARYHVDYDFFNSEPGDIILLRPNAMHSIHPIEDNEHVTDTLQFHLDMIGNSILDQSSLLYLQPLQNSTFKFINRIQPKDEGYAIIKDCLFSIFSIIENEGRYYELILKSKLNELIYHLYYYHYVVKKTSDDLYRMNERIRELIDYIHHHYQDNLTVKFLADKIGYSKTHFMNVFKQHTGTTCKDFIIQVRLQAAADFLVNSMNPILTIAESVGFNNLSNFNRRFKHYYQVTPSQYRKQFKKQTKS